MDENENTLTGFQRVRTGYHNCPHPELIFKWCTGDNAEIEVPRSVQNSLNDLDKLADGWPLIDGLNNRIGNNHPALTRQLLGLDIETRALRLRTAVARATLATWRYSDIFCDWRDARKNAKRILPKAKITLKKLEKDFTQLAEVREKRSWLQEGSKTNLWPSDGVQSSFEDLYCFISDTQEWVNGEDDKAANFPNNAPRLFLFLRLAEIYVCFSGNSLPMHFTKKYTDDPRTKEMNFMAFLVPALTVIGYPSLDGEGYDRVMRDIKNNIDNFDRFRFLGGLVNWNTNNTIRGIDYADFPSTSLHNGLNCFSETEL